MPDDIVHQFGLDKIDSTYYLFIKKTIYSCHWSEWKNTVKHEKKIQGAQENTMHVYVYPYIYQED